MIRYARNFYLNIRLMSTVTVSVPATTANLGPGFDCIGAALTLYNQFQFTLLEGKNTLTLTVSGTEADRVSNDSTNLLYQAFLKFYQHLNQTPPSVAIHIILGVPLARGLGSSATAIVAGLVGANQFAGSPLSIPEMGELAITIEGHPDNVIPALLGNCQLSVNVEEKWQICQIPWYPEVIPVLAIPDFELSTAKARSVLPQQVSRSDAIYNMAHLGLLIRGLETGRSDWLKTAMEDRLHQPFRASLIQGYEAVKTAAIAAGAYGAVISGAGPTLLALTSPVRQEAVAEAMQDAWRRESVGVEVRSLSIDSQGATVTVN